jgi:hypothetical protein
MDDRVAAYDEDRLPWLEAVDEDGAPRGVSARRMLAALVVVLLAVGIVAAAFFWLGRDGSTASGAPELIKAPAASYKVKPADPGGLDIAGESETAYRTSAGEDLDSKLDLGELQDESVTRGTDAKDESEATTAPATPEPVAKPEPKPETPSGASGSVIQLGAYKTQTQAQRGWDALSARFPVVAGLTKMIVPYSGGFRLRAAASSPSAASEACKTVQAGGANCFVAK